MKWDQRRASEEGVSAAPVMDPVLLPFDLCTPHVMYTKLCEGKIHPEGAKVTKAEPWHQGVGKRRGNQNSF